MAKYKTSNVRSTTRPGTQGKTPKQISELKHGPHAEGSMYGFTAGPSIGSKCMSFNHGNGSGRPGTMPKKPGKHGY